MRRRVIFAIRAVAALCLAMAIPLTALAHTSRPVPDTSGIPIPSLTHGQMAVIAKHRGEILDLAAHQESTDETFRRLMNYGAVQYTYCLWGLIPGSLRDEASPFNECSHAYLSAAHALLLHMRTMPGGDEAFLLQVEALVSRIDAEMVRSGASLVLCEFSGETFNTASLIQPIWSGVPTHPPSLIAFSLVGLGLAAGGIGLVSGRRGRSS